MSLCLCNKTLCSTAKPGWGGQDWRDQGWISEGFCTELLPGSLSVEGSQGEQTMRGWACWPEAHLGCMSPERELPLSLRFVFSQRGWNERHTIFMCLQSLPLTPSGCAAMFNAGTRKASWEACDLILVWRFSLRGSRVQKEGHIYHFTPAPNYVCFYKSCETWGINLKIFIFASYPIPHSSYILGICILPWSPLCCLQTTLHSTFHLLGQPALPTGAGIAGPLLCQMSDPCELDAVSGAVYGVQWVLCRLLNG